MPTSTPPIDDYVAHFDALEGMPPDVARELRPVLLRRRAIIDSQLAFVEAAIESAPSNGTPAQPARPPAPPVDTTDKPTRREALLALMVTDPERAWGTTELREALVAQGILAADAKGTHSFHSLIQKCKKRVEIESAGPRRWRLTPRGIAEAKK